MVIFSPCLDCKNFLTTDDTDTLKCLAYPNGIPNEILFDSSASLCLKENVDKTHFEPLK